jgi:hypothetical protein
MDIRSFAVTWTVRIFVLKSISANVNYFILLWKQNDQMDDEYLGILLHQTVVAPYLSLQLIALWRFSTREWWEQTRPWNEVLHQHLLCSLFSGQVNIVLNLLIYIYVYVIIYILMYLDFLHSPWSLCFFYLDLYM